MVAVCALHFFALPGHASVVDPLSISELSIQADRILLGRVLDVEPRWSEDGSIIVSKVHVQPSFVFKGERRAVDTIEVCGGTIGELTLRRTDTPMFESGDGVLLFVNSADELVGTYQGAFYTDGGVVARCEPAVHGIDATFVVALREMADNVSEALNQQRANDQDLRLPGAALPNNGRYVLAGIDWSYQPRPMGETYNINPLANDFWMGPNEGWPIAGIFFGALAWWDRVYANFKFYIGTATNTRTAALDGENVVFFCASGTCGMDPTTVATTFIWSEGQNIIEWDMVFNDVPFMFWNSLLCLVPELQSPCVCPAGHYDIVSIAAHEFGHALGLAHSADPDATMRPVINRCDVTPATLFDDDRLGVIAIYGAIVNEPFEFQGQYDGDQLGMSIASAGDVDRDGVDDLVAGAPFADDGNLNTGSVYVYSGKTGMLLQVFEGTGQHDRIGMAVVAGGDINRDGFDDVIVGSPYASRLRGNVKVYSGKTGEVLHRWDGREDTSDRFGWSVAGNLDVDGDNWKDVVVGVPWEDRNGAFINVGAVHVYSGRTGQRLARFFGEHHDDLFGWSVAGVGRLNSDDHDDFVVGAPFYSEGGRYTGKVYAFSGRHLRTFYTITGPQRGARFGLALTGIAKADPDGKDGFAVAAPYYDRDDREQAGRVGWRSGCGRDQ